MVDSQILAALVCIKAFLVMQVCSSLLSLKLLATEARAWELSLFFCAHIFFLFTLELHCKGDQGAFSYVEDSLQWRSRHAVAWLP
jgi:hypothetical protein